MIDAIVAGHLCLDIIPQFIRAAGETMAAYISPGRLSEVGQAAISTGGAVSNTGINLHRLGMATRLMGKIGDDLFGRAILDIVRGHDPQLAEGMVVVPGEISSYTLVINPPGVDRAFLHCSGANHTFGAQDIRYDLVAEARLFHLGYPPTLGRMYADQGRELIEIYGRAKSLGVTTSLDMTMPDVSGPSGQADWDLILRHLLPQVDLFLPSIEEALFMLDRPAFDELDRAVGAAGMLEAIQVSTVRELAEKAGHYGAKVTALKMGTRGHWFATPGDMTLPSVLGTPGLRNTCFTSNSGPAIGEVLQYPVTPAANSNVVVTCAVHDPDGISSVTLKYRVDPSFVTNTLSMNDNGTNGDVIANDGIYSTTIPGSGKGNGTIV